MADGLIGPEIDLLVFDGSPEPLDEDIVAPGTLTSMLILIPLASSTFVKSMLVNCEAWSVFTSRPARRRLRSAPIRRRRQRPREAENATA